jgi:alpha-beta hydrolase superfamily lysophospholipase
VSTEQVNFPGATGARLVGVLHHPEQERRGSVLLAHCFTCSKDLHTMTRLASGLSEAGYAVLRFDFTGVGDSGGDFADKTIARNVTDLVQAATLLVQRGFGPCAMVGHSLGGAAALLAAARLRTVASVVVIGAPSSPVHVRGLLTGSEAQIRREGVATVEIAGREFAISQEFLDDLERHDQHQHVTGLDRPLCVIHAVHDDVVPVHEGEANFAAARQPKAFIPLLDADHLVTSRAAAAILLDAVIGWLDQTIGRVSGPSPVRERR